MELVVGFACFRTPRCRRSIARPVVGVALPNARCQRVDMETLALAGSRKSGTSVLPWALDEGAQRGLELSDFNPPEAMRCVSRSHRLHMCRCSAVVHSRGSTFQAAGALSCRSENKFVFHRTITILCVSACANSAKLIDTLR